MEGQMVVGMFRKVVCVVRLIKAQISDNLKVIVRILKKGQCSYLDDFKILTDYNTFQYI